MTRTATSYQEVLDEHRELDRRTSELRDMIARPEMESALVAHRLLDLHRQLTAHFRLEEETGFFESLAEEFPQAAHDLERLKGEHGSMLEEGRALVDEAMDEDAALLLSPELRKRIGLLLDHLKRHEREETALVQRSWSEDLGEVE